MESKIKILTEKGYTVQFYQAGFRSATMTKQIGNITVYADITENRDQVKLSGHINLFVITSGWFSITHPRFEELFESRLVDLLELCWRGK